MTTYNLLDKYNEIAHFCTNRQGGVSMGNYASWNLSPFSGDTSGNFNQNKEILCQKLGISSEKLVIPFQTHGTEIREIGEAFFLLSTEEKDGFLNGVDAIFTILPQVCIGITTADCVPLVFYDPIQKVIAAAHAGWRGTCGRIAEKTIMSMVEKHNCKTSDILVAIGPSISAQVYEIGNEVVENFDLAGFDIPQIIVKRNQKIYLDLWQANKQSLIKAGISEENIEISGICTFTEHEKFFSARRLGIKSGRMLSGIMLKNELP
jgi:polyphenol oxidase